MNGLFFTDFAAVHVDEVHLPVKSIHRLLTLNCQSKINMSNSVFLCRLTLLIKLPSAVMNIQRVG